MARLYCSKNFCLFFCFLELNKNLIDFVTKSFINDLNLEEERRKKRSTYKSLEEFANEEGIGAVLEFLSRNPTQISGVYRHTNMSSTLANEYKITKIV